MSDSETETLNNNENQPPAHSATAADPMSYNDPSTVPKHLRLRYWNSWEEMRLVELWRLHSAEVTTLQKNTPVFRTISVGMREFGFYVNSQECRRKINSLKNKYIAERRRMEMEDDKTASDWKLFPLIHSLLAPRQKNQLLCHQHLILDQLFSKTPGELLNKELEALQIHTTPQDQSQLPFTQPCEPSAPQRPPTHGRRVSDGSSFLLRHSFTMTRLTQIRADNRMLADEREAAFRQLQAEERSYKALESFLSQWQEKHEYLLQRIQQGDGK